MVSDKNNEIYTELYEYMKDLYPTLKGGSTYEEGKTKLPFMFFFQLDAPTQLTDLSNNEVGVNLAFQIDIYTNQGTNKAREMANEVRKHMISKGFKCRNFMPIINGSNVSRFVSRYVRLDV